MIIYQWFVCLFDHLRLFQHLFAHIWAVGLLKMLSWMINLLLIPPDFSINFEKHITILIN